MERKSKSKCIKREACQRKKWCQKPKKPPIETKGYFGLAKRRKENQMKIMRKQMPMFLKEMSAHELWTKFVFGKTSNVMECEIHWMQWTWKKPL